MKKSNAYATLLELENFKTELIRHINTAVDNAIKDRMETVRRKYGNRFPTIQDIVDAHLDSIVYAFNTGYGYHDVIVANKSTHLVYAVYTHIDEYVWEAMDEWDAIGNDLNWCIQHLCLGFPLWKCVHRPAKY